MTARYASLVVIFKNENHENSLFNHAGQRKHKYRPTSESVPNHCGTHVFPVPAEYGREYMFIYLYILYIHHHHGRKTIAPVNPVPIPNESLDPENDLLK